MSFLSKLRLYSECFKIGKIAGLIACSKYLCGKLQLEDLTLKSLVIKYKYFEESLYIWR